MDLRRGAIATAAPSGSFSKPRPVLIVQAIFIEPIETVIVAYITSDLQRQPGIRVPVSPSARNGLRLHSEVMVEMIHSVPVHKLGKIVGDLDALTMNEVDVAMRLFLGLP